MGGGDLANDDDHFERGRARKTRSGVWDISADGLPWALKGVGLVSVDERKGVGVHGAGERR